MKCVYLVSTLLGLVVGSPGCGGAKAPQPTIATIVQEPIATSPLDAIYPKEVPNTLLLAPEWVLSAKDIPLAESLKELRLSVDWLAVNDQQNPQSLAGVISTIRVLLYLERALKTEECDSACLDLRIRAYFAMGPWHALFKMEIAKSLLDLALKKLGVQLEGEKLESFRIFLSDTFANSERNWRRLAIDRLRMEGVSPETRTRLLSDLAKAQGRVGEFDRADAIFNMALDSVSDLERTRLLYSMAGNCYRNLDSRCGKARTEEAVKFGHTPPTAADAEWQETMVVLRGAVADVNRLKGAKSFDDSLALAHALTELSRYNSAKKILVALQKKHPRDARPIVGLADLLIEQDFQTGAARKLLIEAKDFENRDTHYYELRVGTWFEDFIKRQSEPDFLASISGDLDELEEAVNEFAPLDRDKGGTLQHVIRIGRVLLQMQQETKSAAAVRAILDESIETLATELISANNSEVPYLRRLQLILARFDRNVERALATTSTVTKLEKHSDLQTQIRLALVLAHKRGRKTFAKELEATQSFVARDMQTGLLATIAYATNDLALWSEIEGQLKQLLKENKEGEIQHRLMNNLAIAYFRQGRKKEAVQLLSQVIQEQSEASVAILNWFVLHPDTTAENFEGLISENITKSTTYQARLWQARKKKKRGLSPAEVRALADIEITKGLNTRVSGDEGVLLEHSFSWGFGYASREHLVITLDLNVSPWFILPGTDRGL